jgi:dipeptidyl aminopeptidase/acylaminoacyl peptidase
VAVRPYGSWRSQISPDLVSGGAGRLLGSAWFVGGRPRWTEIRSDEGGRTVVCEARDGVVHDLTPTGTNARTRVHEYGGGAVWFDGDTVFYSEFGDSRLYRTDGGAPTPITPEPEQPHALRYADGVVTRDGRSIYCVRERHEPDGVVNELVVMPADGADEARVVASGHDFYMWPRLDPEGRRLAWVSWDHPNMPWDETELWTADVREDGTLGEPARVDGGAAVIDPRWSPDGVLHWSSDRTGWWNLYRDGEALTSLDDGEIGFPAWVFGLSHYTFLDDGRIACIVTRNAVETLHLLDPATGALEPLLETWTLFSGGSLDAAGDRLVAVAGSPLDPLAVRTVDVRTREHAVVRPSFDVDLDPATISVPRPIAFTTDDGETAYAFYYPPTNGEDEGPPGERPPLRVICHGGPTAATAPHLSLDVQFFTQRGIGVVDVNYRGSTGYGSEYRKLLNGRWGEIDWQDCVDAARYLAEEGETDIERTWVEGGSAGGYVVLCALTFDPHAFAAGVSYFGVADAEALALETHKFESRYLDSMIGPYPERADLYRKRSPVHFVDRLERPLLLLQGLDDKVVLPAQAEAMVEVLDRKGVPYAYLPFEGEGHGFRKQENIRRAYEATLSFVGQLFGFEPADEIEPIDLVRSAR